MSLSMHLSSVSKRKFDGYTILILVSNNPRFSKKKRGKLIYSEFNDYQELLILPNEILKKIKDKLLYIF